MVDIPGGAPDLPPTLAFCCWFDKVPGCGPPAEIIPNDGVGVVFVELEAISTPPATAAKLPILLALSLELALPPLFPDTNPDVKAGIPEPGLFDFFSLSLILASLTDALLPVTGPATVVVIKDVAVERDPVNFVLTVLPPVKFGLEAIKLANPPAEEELLKTACPKEDGTCPALTLLFDVKVVADTLDEDIPAAPLLVTITVC